MMTLIQKNTFFKWTEKADQDFKKLKTMFISVSILVCLIIHVWLWWKQISQIDA
jgi:membrane protein DedA with SNARE-associated domain